MKIQDIYESYHIHKSLQLHMLRVASIMQILCENWKGVTLNSKKLISSALLHDMGNIVKLTFEKGNKLLEGEDIEALQKLQIKMKEKYGENDHDANVAICNELGIEKSIIEIIDEVSFSKFVHMNLDKNTEKMLLNYCDLRVGPFGILTAHQRLEDAARRYKNAKRRDRLEHSFEQIDNQEKIIFEHLALTPEEINDEAIQSRIDTLRSFDITTTGI